MRALPLLLAALAAAPARADAPAPPVCARLVRTHDFAALTPRQARHLAGKRALFRVVLDSLPGEGAAFVAYDCAGRDDAYRTVRLRGGGEVGEEVGELVVEGV